MILFNYSEIRVVNINIISSSKVVQQDNVTLWLYVIYVTDMYYTQYILFSI